MDEVEQAEPDALARFLGHMLSAAPFRKFARTKAVSEPRRTHAERLGQLLDSVNARLAAAFDFGDGAGVQLGQAGEDDASMAAVATHCAEPFTHGAARCAAGFTALFTQPIGEPRGRTTERAC